MANELKHISVGTQLTQAEYELITGHQFDAQAIGDLLYASSATQLRRLAVGSAGQFLWVTGGIPAWRTLAAGDLPAHGAAEHTNIARNIWLSAGDAYIETGAIARNNNYPVVRATANADLSAYLSLKVPADFVSFTNVKVVWSSPPATGNAYLYLRTSYAADGEERATHGEAPASEAIATSGADKLNIDTPVNGPSLANLAVGYIIGFWFARTGTDVLDTLNDTFDFFGIEFNYVANQ